MPTQHNIRSCMILVGLTALALALLAAQPSHGQDALGGGNALDANPAQGSRFNPPAAQPNFRERNLMITNNVLGGRGFRGSVGYSAEGDFRDALGSDDLFEFRAGSGWSNVNFVNYGSTYERLRYGQDVGDVEYRRTTFAASPEEIRGGVFQGAGFDSGDVVERRLRLDQLSSAVSAPARTATAAEPVNLGYTLSDGEMILINASALQGVSAIPLAGDFQMLGLTSFDMARLRQEAGEGREVGQVGRRFEISYEDLLSGRRLPEDDEEQEERPDLSITQDTRVDPQVLGSPMSLKQEVPQLGSILERVAERYSQRREDVDAEDREDFIRQLDRDMSDLRDRLRGKPEEQEKERERETPLDFERQPAPEVEEETEADGEQTARIEDLGRALRHGEEVRRLAPGDEGRFNELVASGEDYLRKGEWYRAERRFIRALRFAPDHPMATAGLAHAQIGGGLYLSAALTLRNLFTNQPEMIDTRYDEALVPNRPRLSAALQALRKRLDQPNDRALYAFLLAYVGRLMEEPQIISDGLSAMEAAAADDPLVPLLGEIWLAEDDEQAPDAEPEK